MTSHFTYKLRHRDCNPGIPNPHLSPNSEMPGLLLLSVRNMAIPRSEIPAFFSILKSWDWKNGPTFQSLVRHGSRCARRTTKRVTSQNKQFADTDKIRQKNGLIQFQYNYYKCQRTVRLNGLLPPKLAHPFFICGCE
jgi:hypothetical protein